MVEKGKFYGCWYVHLVSWLDSDIAVVLFAFIKRQSEHVSYTANGLHTPDHFSSKGDPLSDSCSLFKLDGISLSFPPSI